jgi:hypothetical protein
MPRKSHRKKKGRRTQKKRKNETAIRERKKTRKGSEPSPFGPPPPIEARESEKESPIGREGESPF